MSPREQDITREIARLRLEKRRERAELAGSAPGAGARWLLLFAAITLATLALVKLVSVA